MGFLFVYVMSCFVYFVCFLGDYFLRLLYLIPHSVFNSREAFFFLKLSTHINKLKSKWFWFSIWLTLMCHTCFPSAKACTGSTLGGEPSYGSLFKDRLSCRAFPGSCPFPVWPSSSNQLMWKCKGLAVLDQFKTTLQGHFNSIASLMALGKISLG